MSGVGGLVLSKGQRRRSWELTGAREISGGVFRGKSHGGFRRKSPAKRNAAITQAKFHGSPRLFAGTQGRSQEPAGLRGLSYKLAWGFRRLCSTTRASCSCPEGELTIFYLQLRRN